MVKSRNFGKLLIDTCNGNAKRNSREYPVNFSDRNESSKNFLQNNIFFSNFSSFLNFSLLTQFFHKNGCQNLIKFRFLMETLHSPPPK